MNAIDMTNNWPGLPAMVVSPPMTYPNIQTMGDAGSLLASPSVQASAGAGAGGVNASVQITGVIVILVIVALVLLSRKWPVL